MSLRIRRGTDAERLTITPLMAEPLWVTDTDSLYVGDGITLGGIRVGGVIPVDTVVEGEAQPGNTKLLLYVNDNETMYRYEPLGAAYVRDGLYILDTLDAGDTRWIGVHGKYVIQDKSIWGSLDVIGTDTEASLGLNIVTNGTFATLDFTGWTAGANWSAATGAAVHIPGSTATLATNGATVLANRWYKVTFTMRNATTGGLQFSFGGTDFEQPAGPMDINATAWSVGIYTTNTNQFIVTPSNGYDGELDDVTISLVDEASPVLELFNQDGTSQIQIRTGGTGNYSFFAGQDCGVMHDGQLNVGIGYRALSGAHNTSNNVGIGFYALRRVSSVASSGNVAIGSSTLQKLGLGSSNTAIGNGSLSSLFTGGYNAGIGPGALRSLVDGQYNVGIGRNTGYLNQNGLRNIFIGDQAGYFETGDDKLYIHSSNSVYPTVWGDLSSRYFCINGQLAGRQETIPAYNNGVGVVAQYTVVKAVGYDFGTTNFVNYDAVSSYNDKPIGILLVAGADSAISREVLKRGPARITGFNTALAAIGDSVYSDDSGALTLTPTQFPVGIVVSLAASGDVYFDFEGSFAYKPLRIFADVAAAEVASGLAGELCFVISTFTFYRYSSVGIGLTDDNTYALSTADGGNTRWIGVAGRYDLYKSLRNLSTVAEAGAIENVTQNDIIFVSDTDTIYRYETVGGAYTVNNTSVLATVDAGNTRWLGISGQYTAEPGELWTIQEEPTGFPIDPTTGEINVGASTITFTDGTRTFEIAPTGASFDIYIQGKRYDLTTENVVIPDVEGVHYIYFDDTATLQSTQVWDNEIFYSYVYVGAVYWDATNNLGIYVGDERHGVKMDGHTHALLHSTQGTKFQSGCALNTITTEQAGSANSHAQFGVDTGSIVDEDLWHSLAAVLSTTGLPIYYKLGAAGDWRRTTNAGYSFAVGGTPLPQWNEWTGATWQLTEVTNNRYLLVHVFATNDPTNEYIAVPGQAEYLSKNAAQTGANVEVANLVTAGMPFQEFIPVGSVIFQGSTAYTNTPQARIRETDLGGDYVDWRFSGVSPSSISVNSHSNLADLTNDDHRAVYQAKEGRTGDLVANATTGTIDDLANATYTGFIFNGAGAVTLRGLVAAKDSKNITIINDTGNPLSINDEDVGSAAANRITTGTGSALTLVDTASIRLEYEETSQRWRVIGGTGGGTPAPPTGDPLAIRLAALEVDGAVNLIDTDLSLYQVAALSSVLAGSVVITNRNAASVNVRVAHVDGAIGAVANADYITYDGMLLPYETKVFEIPGMAASDSILVRSDTVDVNFKFSGFFTVTVEALKRIAAYNVAVINTNEQVVSLVNNTANFKFYLCNKNATTSATVRIALIDGALGTWADEDNSLNEEILTSGETRSYKLGEGLALGGTVGIYSSSTDVNIILYGEIF